jgi:hypothetical protein
MHNVITIGAKNDPNWAIAWIMLPKVACTLRGKVSVYNIITIVYAHAELKRKY